MLRKARSKQPSHNLIQDSSDYLPVKKNGFDLIYCINAIHHFKKPYEFVKECKSLLRKNGILVIVGMDPHIGSDKWFVYDYFKGTYERDLHRYPSSDTLKDWLTQTGFGNIHFQVGERVQNRIMGQDVFPIPKGYTSQLSLLTDQEYDAGIKRIKEAIDAAALKNEVVEFHVDISLSMVTAISDG